MCYTVDKWIFEEKQIFSGNRIKNADKEEQQMKRVFLIVLDSFGIGEMPDAAKYGDEGSNTLEPWQRARNFPCRIWKNWDYSILMV